MRIKDLKIIENNLLITKNDAIISRNEIEI
jgi:hypothetical protein